MQKIEGAIQEGARAFMGRQYGTIAIIAAIVAVIFALAIGTMRGWMDGLRTAVAFSLGSALSAASGYIGMYISIRANSRTANEGLSSFGGALRTALRGGAVSGLTIVGFSLLGVWGLYEGYNAWFGGASQQLQNNVILSMVGFGFGASLVALFAQLGGGIYTKAADVGADLVGKVEGGIPEADTRTPAVIADLVGDNVGDCAGRGADLFESTAAENIGAMILAAGLYRANEAVFQEQSLTLLGVLLFPLVARAFGIIASMIGIMSVKANENEDPMSALNRGYYITAGLAMVGFYIASRWLLGPEYYFRFFICGVIGVLTSVAFVYITQYYTAYS